MEHLMNAENAALDALRELKAAPPSRETSIAVTKLEEALHRISDALGQQVDHRISGASQQAMTDEARFQILSGPGGYTPEPIAPEGEGYQRYTGKVDLKVGKDDR